MNTLIIRCKVITNSSQSKILWDEERSFFKIHLTSQREKGKANNAIINLISKTFDLPYSKIKIESGCFLEYKLISIETTNIKDITNKINLLKE